MPTTQPDSKRAPEAVLPGGDRIGERLVAAGACAAGDVEQALEVQESYGGRLGSILMNLGHITEDQLLAALAAQLGLTVLDSAEGCQVLELAFPAQALQSHRAIPLADDGQVLQVLTNDPMQAEFFALLGRELERRVKLVLGRDEFVRQLALQLDAEDMVARSDLVDMDDEIDRLKELASEAPVIKLVNGLLGKAVERGASDIHFEALRRVMKVRFRVDGVLHLVDTVPRHLEPAVIARLKLVAGMNIAENRLPQDGRISLRIAGQEIDIRASSVPTQFGESFVVRLLEREGMEYRVDRLGLYADHVETVRAIARQPNGIFLTTGPTGSGKTTTLYAMLSEISDETNKVVTVENPVEYELATANQINVRTEIEYTFARALRSILRQDPDVIMVGEIRDLETAEVAIQAALTGHLVFSTLHTNGALDSLTRLLDMGLDYYLLKACICGLMAQRLVRRLCEHCAAAGTVPEAARAHYELDALLAAYPFVTEAVQAPGGCEQCGRTGYRGRLVIAEVLACDAAFLAEVEAAGDYSDITRWGTRSMVQDGLLKALAGQTSLDEVLRVSR